MKREKAKKEIKKLYDSGLSFDYDLDFNPINKLNLAIYKEGYSIKDIVSKLKEGEKIIFMVNDGKRWDGKHDQKFNLKYNKKYDGSIYWENDYYGDIVRVSSDMGSLQKWGEELNKKFIVNENNRDNNIMENKKKE